MFADRTSWNREESALALAVAARRAEARPVLDLTAANPTRCGFQQDAAAILAPLAAAEALVYEPQPFGREQARRAVAAYYAGRGGHLSQPKSTQALLAVPTAVPLEIPIADLCLTTSTSEAYSYLFRLLCNAGDEVLIATPSYPLFDYLADLEDVHLVRYPLLYEHGWQIEPGALAARITSRTRAIALVHPNNPTGHFVTPEEREALEHLCVLHDLALIVDEVFLDYAWAGEAPSFAAGPHPALTFVLSGVSKVLALPQMKLSWLAMLGPPAARGEARARLEVIADSFLSVNAPVQQALPAWLAMGAAVREPIKQRIADNLGLLDALLAGTAASRLASDGGWYAVLRVPALEDSEAFALALLREHGVLVHPGGAFGFAERGWLVLSLLPERVVFEAGVQALVRRVVEMVVEMAKRAPGERMA